jgi:hypothetical protein
MQEVTEGMEKQRMYGMSNENDARSKWEDEKSNWIEERVSEWIWGTLKEGKEQLKGWEEQLKGREEQPQRWGEITEGIIREKEGIKIIKWRDDKSNTKDREEMKGLEEQQNDFMMSLKGNKKSLKSYKEQW